MIFVCVYCLETFLIHSNNVTVNTFAMFLLKKFPANIFVNTLVVIFLPFVFFHLFVLSVLLNIFSHVFPNRAVQVYESLWNKDCNDSNSDNEDNNNGFQISLTNLSYWNKTSSTNFCLKFKRMNSHLFLLKTLGFLMFSRGYGLELIRSNLLINFNPLTTNVLHQIETSQLICITNQLTGFYMMGNISR